MKPQLSFARRLFGGLFITLALATWLTIGGVFSLRMVVQSKDVVAFDYSQDLIDLLHLNILSQRIESAGRGYLLTGDRIYLERMVTNERAYSEKVDHLAKMISTTEGQDHLRRLQKLSRDHEKAMGRVLQLHDNHAPPKAIGRFFELDVQPTRDQLSRILSELGDHLTDLLEQSRKKSTLDAARGTKTVIFSGAAAILLAIVFGLLFIRVLNRMYERERSAITERDNVLAIVSHDLKNPISSILMNAELLAKFSVPEETRVNLTKVSDLICLSATKMQRLIRDLLDLAKLEAGQMKLDIQSVNLTSLISETIAILKASAEKKGIKLVMESQSPELAACLDSDRLTQVLSNVIGNAIKFTPEGGEVVVRAEPFTRTEVLISVRDTGPGIPPDKLDLIFERYKQARDSDRRSGTGLGLFISKEIVQAHHGKIWAESELGKGSTFFFTLEKAPPVSVSKKAS